MIVAHMIMIGGGLSLSGLGLIGYANAFSDFDAVAGIGVTIFGFMLFAAGLVGAFA